MALYRSLPLPGEKDNMYYVMPGAGGPSQEEASANARQMVSAINPAYLEFTKTYRASFRPFALLITAWAGGFMLLSSLPDLYKVNFGFGKINWNDDFLAAFLLNAVSILVPAICAAIFFKQLRSPQSRIILSRKLRRFYQWQGKKSGWTWVDYDKAVPAVYGHMAVTPYGASSMYMLDVNEIEPATRKILKGIRVSDAANAVLPQAELWEFIRLYMDAPAHKVPPIEYRIPEGQSHGIHARIDRDTIPGLLDDEHRLKPGLFNKLYFGMGAMFGYWADRMIPWIERHTPHPPLPPELEKSMQWSGENPYRTTPPTEIEQKAIDGKLPYMNLRWRIGMTLSTLFYGGSFLFMVFVGWREVIFGPD
ncbi:hypothetical protein JR065_05965 [Xanthomonas sp. AmX2]|uniref:hypothetical protein n=1 Tax=Xanthomonas sp. TaxID=29446 RepID=UPI00197EE6B5|nr:hypothetical protein [Xanthomonas sp.]MBN6149878.1 hypothetical protein [Xanthomonas sp.]